MYVDLRILSSTYSIQLRDEAGAAIGSEITYSNTNYKLVRDTASQTYLILEATRNDTASSHCCFTIWKNCNSLRLIFHQKRQI